MAYQWTSEYVSRGHPDKVADQIADAVLDLHLELDRNARVAVEVLVTRISAGDTVVITGEIGSSNLPTSTQVESVVYKVLEEIGYRPGSFWPGSLAGGVFNWLRSQSVQISAAVDEGGAGDQGMMFGFACDESPDFIPLTHYLARKLIHLLKHEQLHPDAKSQVTIRYSDKAQPRHLDTVLVSTCHDEKLTHDELTSLVRGVVFELPKDTRGYESAIADLLDSETRIIINPAGLWTFGGPAADTGLSGRKIVVDNYGPDCPIGGGSFSGKDPTKVDRSGAYMARYLAKNIVAQGLCKRCRVQLSYGIGIAEPLSFRVETTKPKTDRALEKSIRKKIDLTPKGIIECFDLRRPIYYATGEHGHFGNEVHPWEQLMEENLL